SVQFQLGAGQLGQHPVEITLGPQIDVRPASILSEGERTCVALAGTLAELEATGNNSALVLDAPVTSLDHRNRRRVADRLVEESLRRQVIVFTHDLVFLYFLRSIARDRSIGPTFVAVQRGYRRDHGRAADGLPWAAMRLNERIGQLRRDLVVA